MKFELALYRSLSKSLGDEFVGQGPEALSGLRVVGLGVRSGLAGAVVVAAGAVDVEEPEGGRGALFDGAEGVDSGFADHRGVHVRRRVQGVDPGLGQFLREIDG